MAPDIRPDIQIQNDPPAPTAASPVELRPSYRIPLGLAAIAGAVAWLSPWAAMPVALLALFLAFQSRTLRLRFTESALDIYRGDHRLRHFPYADWLHWDIFWPAVPILFYFREVNSIHFLPILVNPGELRSSLETHCSPEAGTDLIR